jgi:dTDP-4-dehydrorhamnose reductase
MLVLIYGSLGWIGQQFIEILKKENINYVLGKARCDNKEFLINEIENIKPTHVISFIGRTHGVTEDGKVYTTIDYLEQPGKLYENVRDNLFSPLLLAHICNKLNIHYTYLGTGCVYSNQDCTIEHAFSDNEKPNFFGSSYSTVKGFTQQLIELYENNVLQLKIRMPITSTNNPRNFITKITNYEKICSIPNSMTILPELLPIALDMMKTNSVGTYNYTNPGVISHNEILEMYREIVNPEFTWSNFSIEEQDKILASKRSNNYLDTTKLENYVKSRNLQLSNIKDGLRKVLYAYKSDLEKDDTSLEG